MAHIPVKFDQFLGPFGPVLYDPTADQNCAPIAVGFGHRIVGSLGESLWNELGQYGRQVYNHEGHYWVLVTRQLSRDEAILTYGPVTNEEIGPRGGWRSVTFGTTRFTSKLMAPLDVQNRPKKTRKSSKPDVQKHDAEAVLAAYQKLYGDPNEETS